MVLLAWPYFLVVALKAGVLARLLGPEFDLGTTALTVLAIAMLASAFAGPVDLALLMLGRTRDSLAITMVALTIDLVVAVIAIPRLGLLGAALAWGAAVVVQNGLASIQVHRVGGLRAGGRPAIIAGLGAIAAVVPAGLATPDHLGGAVATVAVGGLVWLAVAATFRRPLGLVPAS
jgi:O-antigen/teichoic acid export membrane protein